MLNPIEEIKNRLDVVEVISGYIKLKKAGANYRAPCPFHSEKKPSLFVSPSKQIWKCFGCSRGGDVFAFIKEIEGIEFVDALRILAQKAGVELKHVKPEFKSNRDRLYKICELSTRFFQKQLSESSVGKQAEKYLFDRKISKESIKKWRIGYAPNSWHALSNFLISLNYKKQEIQQAGVLVKNEKGLFFDRFRGRIIFPIFDFNSQVVGFGARIFNPDKKKGEPETIAKYLNTPNTLLYDKSKILYGANEARMEIRKKNGCILVEGYIDVILSHQAGIKNIVSTSGTALTPFQLNILKRYSNNLILGFDMDVAGDTATKRSIDMAQEKGFEIKILLMPKDNDPADVISKNPKKWQEIVDKAQNILDFYFKTTLTKFDKEKPEHKKEISNILLPVIKKIPNKIVRFHWIQKLAQELGVREKDIEQELEAIKTGESEKEQKSAPEVSEQNQQKIFENELLILIMQNKENIVLLEEKNLGFLSPETLQIISSLQKSDMDTEKLKKQVSPELFEQIQLLLFEAEIREELKDPQEQIQKCLARIEHLKVKEELELISKKIKQAETKKDFKAVETLTQEFNQLSKNLKA